MSLSGVSGSAVGYANFIAIFVISINSVIDMLYLRVFTCHALLVSTSFMFMMTLMMNFFDKHIYDILFMFFLLASFLWNNLNMKMPRFLTVCQADGDGPRPRCLICSAVVDVICV